MSSRDSYHALGTVPESKATSEPFNNLLSSSISSITSTASRHTSPISKTYRQASTLFLTRRLPEALTTLLPLITPPEPVESGEPAPVAKASRTTRVKVWSLYLTILNAIVELEPEEGKDAFGGQEWRALCSKVRDGQVWAEVIANGYHGVEGDVDADVVINLATILLAHARDQVLNQQRLEAYLAAAQTLNLDFPSNNNHARSQSRSSTRYRSPAPGASGTNTPRDLNARVKILELYTLHVLLRNNEWDYAREFISVNTLLDEERREAFLLALQSLQEEQQDQERREREEKEHHEEQLRREAEEAKRLRAENEERERQRLEEERKRRQGNEEDYGVDTSSQAPPPSKIPTNRHNGKPPTAAVSAPDPSRGREAAARPRRKPAGPLTLTARASLIMSRLRHIIEQLAITLNHNPVFVTRFLLFLMSFIFMLGHKGIRERLRRVLGTSWLKLKATAGMGTKVSYI